jgi:hypothetical protein
VSKRTLTFWSKIISGASFDICVVPPKPVTLQNMSYKGTAANESPNMIKNIPARIMGVKVLLFTIMIYRKHPYYKV